MSMLKILSSAMLALALCAGVRADDDCPACAKAKCDSCSTGDTVRHAAAPVKDFFVHDVSCTFTHTIAGTISHGFHWGRCKSEEVKTEVKSDCGCNK